MAAFGGTALVNENTFRFWKVIIIYELSKSRAGKHLERPKSPLGGQSYGSIMSLHEVFSYVKKKIVKTNLKGFEPPSYESSFGCKHWPTFHVFRQIEDKVKAIGLNWNINDPY